MKAATIALVVAMALAAAVAQNRRQQRRAAETPQPATRSVEPVPMPSRGMAVQISMGLKDTEPADWDADITVSEGTVAELEESAPGVERARGGRRAAKAAKKAQRAGRAQSRQQGQGANRRLVPGTLIAQFDAPPTARATVKTSRGEFAFALSELRYGAPLKFLEGAVAVERVPVTAQITSDPTEDDYPACAASPDGRGVWCAYVAYQHGNPINDDEVNKGKFDSLITKGNGDHVRLIHFDGKQWNAPLDATESLTDVWRPSVAVDGKGTVWVVWAQGTAGEWDLYARSYDPAANRWAAVQRITSEPGTDFNVVATRGKSGNVWIAWQRWEKGDFGIRAQALGTPAASRRSRNFQGSNEWNPAIAADATGKIYVAFDSYTSGSYDIFLWTLDEASPATDTLLPVAASPRFEARPSIAVDRENRVWVAYEDAAPNWGKDYGTRWEGKSGVPFYLDRDVIVRVVGNGTVHQTGGEIRGHAVQTMYPPSQRKRLSMPRLGADATGRVWLLFRQHPLATGQGERWMSYATRYDGNAWSEPVQLPNSVNTLDNRPALAPLNASTAVAVYSTDDRPAGNASGNENNLHAALLEREGETQSAVLRAMPAAPPEQADPVHPREAEDIARLRAYRVNVAGKSYQPLRGEFHRHTELTSHRDQDGPLEEIWRYGLDVARMDWIGPGDHDYGAGREYTWWLIQKQVEFYFHAPVFLPVFTHERSVVYPSGHRNVIFTKRGVRALPRMANAQQPEILFGTEEGGSPDIKNLYAYLKHFDAICSSHTSATNMGTDWRDNDPAVEPVVEIFQGHRQNYEEPAAPYAAKDAQDSIGGYEPKGYVWNAFAKGYKLGFQASSDHVSTHLSYAIVWAERPTREGLLEGFKKRHSYAAHDNIVLDVRSGQHMMGDEFDSKTQPRIDITITGTAPVAQVDIVRQAGASSRPAYVYNTQPKLQNVKLTWTDTSARPGLNMYYVRIRQADGKMAWASPMWIQYQP